jgi:uncharacterized protein YbjT (DUF2867 family)
VKVAVIGGTGLIGSKTVAILRRGGDEVVAASRKAGVNTVAGQGLGGAMAGARVVIDVSNAPSFDTKAVREFFEASGRNLLAVGASAGVRHHVILSIIVTNRVPSQVYYRAKVRKTNWSRLRACAMNIRTTQFLEFLHAIAEASTDEHFVRLPPGLLQPIATDDVAAIINEVALASRETDHRGRRSGTSAVQGRSLFGVCGRQ